MNQTNSWRNHLERSALLPFCSHRSRTDESDPLPALYDHPDIRSISEARSLITPVTRNFLHSSLQETDPDDVLNGDASTEWLLQSTVFKRNI
jgi:hypothetical protein